FGPNLLSCKNGQCERVRAVNRAPRSFSAGSVVLLSNIDGEWIIQDFGANPEDLKPAATSFGEWSFTKLIASSDNYFKDDRFWLDDTAKQRLKDTTRVKVNQTVSPSEYEYQSRLQFFYNFYKKCASGSVYGEINFLYLKQIAELNLDTTTIDEFVSKELWFYPSQRYLVATAFDQISSAFGGFSSATYISKTNISTGDFPNFNGYPQAVEVPLFWGPVFTQGYKKLAVDTTNLNQKNQSKYFVLEYNRPREENPDEVNISPISLPSVFASHIPAELTSKILDTLDIIENWGQLGQQTIVQTHIKTPAYNSKKNSLNEIQFSPLYADMAAHDDPVSQVAKDVVRQYYINSRIIAANNILGLNITSINDFPDENMWGYMYNRNSQRGLVKYEEASQELFDAVQENCGAYELNNAASLASWAGVPFISYDCFIKQFPTNIPTGAPDEFRDTNSNSIGANLVGVIAGKQTISKRRGGKIDFTCKQYFGLPQKRTVSGSTGGISILPIGGVGVVIGANPPGINQNAFPQWGSSLNDRYDSFGTTALHVRIFDYWPEENTIFDPRYYGVLHFNPGELFSEATVENKGLSTEDIQNKYGGQYSVDNLPPNISYADIPRKVSQTTDVTNSIDIRMPTYGVEFLKNASPSRSSDGYTIPVGTIINNDTKPLRPNNEWNISTIRRGQMLTEGGFHYLYRAIGLSDNYDIAKKGKGFEVGQQLTLAGSRAVEIEITKVEDGGIKEFKFISTNNLGDENGRGVNFLPSDFSSNPTTEDVTLKCYKLTIPAPPEGESASIEFYSGIVYMRHGLDIGPVEHVPPKLISSSSKAGLGSGKGPVDETKTSDVTLGENTSGQYDCFYFFHNDITHTPMRAFTFSPGFAQHITLTIS
ncbi:MAG: hypothetical protein VKK63_09775, partial [Synechococcus sp.]|nr:hypothetical protein [Synechococcus sp.]